VQSKCSVYISCMHEWNCVVLCCIVPLLDMVHSTGFVHLSQICEACVRWGWPVLSVATFIQIFTFAKGLG
jgi:hypothetical protein